MKIRMGDLSLKIADNVSADPPGWFIPDLEFEYPFQVRAGLVAMVKEYGGKLVVTVNLWKSSNPSADEKPCGQVICLNKGTDEIPEIETISRTSEISQQSGPRDLGFKNGIGENREIKQSGSIPAISEITPDLRDLENMQESAKKVGPVLKAGSHVAGAVGIVNDILEKLRTVGWGIPWKAVSKAIPSINALADSVGDIENGMRRLVAPTDVISKLLPGVIQGIQARQNSELTPSGLSGQIGAIVGIIPILQKDLITLNNLMESTGKAVNNVANSTGRLKSVKGIGSLAEKLQVALIELDNANTSAQRSIQELAGTFDNTSKWLPEYQRKIRQKSGSNKTCQMITKSSFLKKQLCEQPVSWFDDESPGICQKCGINICEKHRVETSAPMGLPVRCHWLCINCATQK